MATEGWTFLWNSTKWHYFVEGRSLCGRFLLLANPAFDCHIDSPDNCKACLRKYQARLQKDTAHAD